MNKDQSQPSPVFFLQGPDPPPRIPAMTCCIAAICDDGNAIVLAADRFTWGVHAALETELESAKFSFLDDRTAWMASGVSAHGDEVVNRYLSTVGDAELGAVKIAERFMHVCQEVRHGHIENTITKRNLGLPFKEFQELLMSKNSTVAGEVYKQTTQYELGLFLIIAGIDQSGAHLQYVTEIQNSSMAELGYLAVGSGTVIANVMLAHRKHKKSSSLSEGLFNVYEAKRAAELARGVGEKTDISVIRKGLPQLHVGEATMAALAATSERLKPQPISADEIAAIAASLR